MHKAMSVRHSVFLNRELNEIVSINQSDRVTLTYSTFVKHSYNCSFSVTYL